MTPGQRADQATTTTFTVFAPLPFPPSWGFLESRAIGMSLKEALRVGKTVGGALLEGVHHVHERPALSD